MSIDSVSVSSIMTKDVKTATESQTIHNICKIMCDNNIGDVIIVKEFGSEPVGIITERDIVNQMALMPSSLQIAVREFMSKPLITMSANNTIKDAIQTMQLKDIRRLLVVDNRGKAIGIITDKDIFRAIRTNKNLLTSLLSDQLLIEHRTVLEQLNENIFSDIFHPR
jgi:predicted transcriptional regulator